MYTVVRNEGKTPFVTISLWWDTDTTLYRLHPIVGSEVVEALLYEIWTGRHIHPEVVTWCHEHQDELVLRDDQGIAYEIPRIGYVFRETRSQAQFVATFGQSPGHGVTARNTISDQWWGPRGVYVSFTPTTWSTSRWVIRLAVWVGNNKVLCNALSDDMDPTTEKEDELLSRVQDTQGAWMHTHDSIHLSTEHPVYADDGRWIVNDQCALAHVGDQTPLSYASLPTQN